MVVRELSLGGGLVHPTTLEGRGIWLDPEVQDLLDRLHHGDATLGWAGDERLALYRTEDKRWELWRLEHDGEYRPVIRSKPGVGLNNSLITHLVGIDAQRGFNPADHVDKVNAKVDAAKDYQSTQKVHAAAEKLHWALRRDLG